MKCPNDQTTLTMSERHGIEIDYCPECRGVWLDRGELDKIIERGSPSAPTQERPIATPQYDNIDHARSEYRHPSDQKYYKRKKKDSFLGELFDF